MSTATVTNRHINWVVIVILATLFFLLLALPVSAVCILGERAGLGSVNSQDGAVAVSSREHPRSGSQEIASQLVQDPMLDAIVDPFHELSQGRHAYFEREYHWAIRHFERAMAGLGDDACYSMWAGMAAFRIGDFVSAENHWRKLGDLSESNPSVRGWATIGLTAVYLETDNVELAAETILEWERIVSSGMLLGTGVGKEDQGSQINPQISRSIRPVMDYYSGLVYERLASLSWGELEQLRRNWLLDLVPTIASNANVTDRVVDGGQPSVIAGSTNRSWLIYLARRAYRKAMTAVQDPYWQAAPVVDKLATMHPRFSPTVGEFLDAIGSTDYARQAKQRLSSLNEPRPAEPQPEIFDLPAGPLWVKEIC